MEETNIDKSPTHLHNISIYKEEEMRTGNRVGFNNIYIDYNKNILQHFAQLDTSLRNGGQCQNYILKERNGIQV